MIPDPSPFSFVLQFLSLLDSSAAFNCEAIRDCYEAFALYCFERYMIACLGMSSMLKTLLFSSSFDAYYVIVLLELALFNSNHEIFLF